jgi:hypothetical protein
MSILFIIVVFDLFLQNAKVGIIIDKQKKYGGYFIIFGFADDERPLSVAPSATVPIKNAPLTHCHEKHLLLTMNERVHQ